MNSLTFNIQKTFQWTKIRNDINSQTISSIGRELAKIQCGYEIEILMFKIPKRLQQNNNNNNNNIIRQIHTPCSYRIIANLYMLHKTTLSIVCVVAKKLLLATFSSNKPFCQQLSSAYLNSDHYSILTMLTRAFLNKFSVIIKSMSICWIGQSEQNKYQRILP